MKNDDKFDFSIESIDMFRFQEKDFREEKKRVQDMILKEQAEEAKKNQGVTQGRNRRQAAMNALENMDGVHSLANLNKMKSKDTTAADYASMPKKDKSISV